MIPQAEEIISALPTPWEPLANKDFGAQDVN
jgi:hypothetical protein